VYAPVSGEVVEGNPALTETPELINQDPYGAGWLMRVRMSNSAELDSLLDAKAYEDLLASDSH
jgi:glycine cleavage system H protein